MIISHLKPYKCLQIIGISNTLNYITVCKPVIIIE